MTNYLRNIIVGLVVLFYLLFFVNINGASAATLKPIRFETDNGMTLLILEQASLPVVSIQVLVRTGSIYDPKGKTGLANLTGDLLEEGTKNRNSMEISEAIDFIGSKFSTRTSKDYTTVQMRVLKKDIETGFDILSDMLIEPSFPSKEIERMKKQVVGNILARKDQPGAIAKIAFQKMIYGNHPYRYPIIGLEETIPKIRRRDLVNFHQQYYRPNNTIIAIVGDVTEQDAKSLVQTHFGEWEKESLSISDLDPPEPIRTKEIKQIDKDLSQATVILGHIGIDRANPDYYAIRVMNYILGGGGFSSRMLSDIRDNKGLVYSVYSYFSANRYPGTFSVSLKTKNDNANEAIRAVLHQIQKIREAGVTAEELSEAKAYLSGSFPLRIDTSKKVASLLATIEFYGLGLDYFESHTEQIKRVTREDVFRVALKYLHPNRYALVVVGKQSAIKIDSIGNGATD